MTGVARQPKNCVRTTTRSSSAITTHRRNSGCLCDSVLTSHFQTVTRLRWVCSVDLVVVICSCLWDLFCNVILDNDYDDDDDSDNDTNNDYHITLEKESVRRV